MNDTAAIGSALAARHQTPATFDATISALNYSEAVRTEDWTLRSALVRLAQPEPVRAGVVLELIRRCDAALHPFARKLESFVVNCDRELTVDGLLAAETGAVRSYPDARITDLARISKLEPQGLPAIIETYAEAHQELADEERSALRLVEVALDLDNLGDVLAKWASGPPGTAPPVEQVDALSSKAFEQLEALGVAREQGPPRAPRRRAKS